MTPRVEAAIDAFGDELNRQEITPANRARLVKLVGEMGTALVEEAVQRTAEVVENALSGTD